MTLQFDHFVREEFNRRSNSDRRKRVNWMLVSYYGEDGKEYRKGFEFPVTTNYDAMMGLVPNTINQ